MEDVTESCGLYGDIPDAGSQDDRRPRQMQLRVRLTGERGAGRQGNRERRDQIGLRIEGRPQRIAVDNVVRAQQQVERAQQRPDAETDGPVQQEVLLRAKYEPRQLIGLPWHLYIQHQFHDVGDEHRQQKEQWRAHAIAELLPERIAQFGVCVARHDNGVAYHAPQRPWIEDQPRHDLIDEFFK